MFTTTVAVCGLFCLYYVYLQYVHICNKVVIKGRGRLCAKTG